MLHNSIVAGVDIAGAHIVAFKNHWWFLEVEALFQHAVLVVPGPHRYIRALTSILVLTIVFALAMLQVCNVTVNWQGSSDHIVLYITRNRFYNELLIWYLVNTYT